MIYRMGVQTMRNFGTEPCVDKSPNPPNSLNWLQGVKVCVNKSRFPQGIVEFCPGQIQLNHSPAAESTQGGQSMRCRIFGIGGRDALRRSPPATRNTLASR